MEITRRDFFGVTYINFRSPITRFSVSIGIVNDTGEIELGWNGTMSHHHRMALGLEFDDHVGTIERARELSKLMAAAADMADEIRAGTFDISQIPEEPGRGRRSA